MVTGSLDTLKKWWCEKRPKLKPPQAKSEVRGNISDKCWPTGNLASWKPWFFKGLQTLGQHFTPSTPSSGKWVVIPRHK